MKLALLALVAALVVLHRVTDASAHVWEQGWIKVKPHHAKRHHRKHRRHRVTWHHLRLVRAHRAVRIALRLRGVPYVWGGTTTRGFDCSGLVQYVFRHIGVSIPRTTWSQMRVGRLASRAGLYPGDAIYVNGGEHVGLYIGRGLIVNAPHTGTVVQIQPLSWFSFYTARRFW